VTPTVTEVVSEEPVQLLDEETWIEGIAAFRRAYERAVELVAPRIANRTLVAAGGDEQLLTDEEWDDIVQEEVSDEIGDAVLSGVMAGVLTFGLLAPPTLLAARAAQHVLGLTGYAPQIRLRLNNWIAERQIADMNVDEIAELLRTSSPLSANVADQVTRTEMQGAANGGLSGTIDQAQPAAVRWVTRRDLRVRFEHAVADQDTVPFGQPFMIGGYPAMYPGDPQLPFPLRVNCRCELAYVEGTEARQAVGATKEELTVKAQELNISGRSKMSKSELQFAILKELCLQGRAGGPDCPDKFEDMNRTALLTLARHGKIVGRHAMSRPQLITALRQSLRGDDSILTAQGYSPRAVFGAAQKKAAYKRGRAPKPTAEMAAQGQIPPIARRRESRDELFAQFGGPERGYVPCVHCGLKLAADKTSGLAVMVPEPIVPWSEGGGLELANLLPSCSSCFLARGGRGMVSSAGDVPRDENGRWTKGGGSVGSTGTVPKGTKKHSTPVGDIQTTSMKKYLLVGEDTWGEPGAKIFTGSNNKGTIDEFIKFDSGRKVDGSPRRIFTVDQITGEIVEVEPGRVPKKNFALVASGAPVEGQMVSARVLGWDLGQNSSEWALDRSDMPRLTTVVGALTINEVADPDYTQYVVNGIPIDPSTIVAITLPGEVLVAAAGRVCESCGLPEAPTEFKTGIAVVPRDQGGKWCKGAQCHETQQLQTMDAAEFAKKSPSDRVSAPGEWFASDEELAETQALANQKARDVPQPTAEKIAHNKMQAEKAKAGQGRAGGDNRGSSATRRARGEALFDEFGGRKRGYVPCTHCGIKTSPKGRGGYASMEQDKILTLNEGGSYGGVKSFPNLIPSCSGCNKNRGEKPYPVRPSWEGTGLSVLRGFTFALSRAEATDRVDDEVVAFPLGWDDPKLDVLDRPVQGLLGKRTVTPFFGAYEQWIVGGEVVDPDHIYDIDDPLVASAGSLMCPNCGGWTVGLAAAGGWAPEGGFSGDPTAPQYSPLAKKDVPRDPYGKWCKGAQCQIGGQMQIGGLEAPLEGPSVSGKGVEYDQMTPGQKAAWTKKQNAIAAEAKKAQIAQELAEQQKAVAMQKQIANETLTAQHQKGEPLDSKALKDDATDEFVDNYLNESLGSKGAAAAPKDAATRRELAVTINNQHIADQDELSSLGYTPNTPAGARESRRTVLRESGERRPTGGPNPSKSHVFYSDEEIGAMSREKQAALVAHHSGGNVTQAQALEQKDGILRASAIGSNKSYRENVTDLRNLGYDDSEIPHSSYSTNAMWSGKSKGYGTGSPKPKVPVISTAPGATGKPSNWDSLSGGQKAAWTKQYNAIHGPGAAQKLNAPGAAPKPPEWDSWGPGQKAAWTKGQNVKGATTTSKVGGGSGKLGTHSTKTFSSRQDAANELKKTVFSGGPINTEGTAAHKARQSHQKTTLQPDEYNAISYYGGSGYGPMNGIMKRGEKGTPDTRKKVTVMKGAYKGPAATPAPTQLIRGKTSRSGSKMQELDLQVGDEYTDKGFGSWSSSRTTAMGFAGGAYLDHGETKVVVKMVNSHNVPSLASFTGEMETIMPADSRYRVLSIVDHVGPTGGPMRYMEVELILP